MKNDDDMSPKQFLELIAQRLVHEIKPVFNIKGFTNNSVLLGAYTEAVIRAFTVRVVNPMRVSTGTILDYPLASKLPPIALIIWTPFPSPAIFEVGDFALVPKSSAFGLIEVKRSNYPETETAFEAFFESARGMISAPAGSRTVLGSCLSLKKILAID